MRFSKFPPGQSGLSTSRRAAVDSQADTVTLLLLARLALLHQHFSIFLLGRDAEIVQCPYKQCRGYKTAREEFVCPSSQYCQPVVQAGLLVSIARSAGFLLSSSEICGGMLTIAPPEIPEPFSQIGSRAEWKSTLKLNGNFSNLFKYFKQGFLDVWTAK